MLEKLKIKKLIVCYTNQIKDTFINLEVEKNLYITKDKIIIKRENKQLIIFLSNVNKYIIEK